MKVGSRKNKTGALRLILAILFSAAFILAALASCNQPSDTDESEKTNLYEVKFLTEEGIKLASKTCNEGENLVPPKAQVKENAIFTGWGRSTTDISSDTTLIATYMDLSGIKNAVCADSVFASSTSEFVVKVGIRGSVSFSSVDLDAIYDSDLLELIAVVPANSHASASKGSDGSVNITYNAPKNTNGYTTLASLVFKSKSIGGCKTEVEFDVNSMYFNQQGLLMPTHEYKAFSANVVIIDAEGESFDVLPHAYVHSTVSGIRPQSNRGDEFDLDFKILSSAEESSDSADSTHTVTYSYYATDGEGNPVDWSRLIEIISFENHKYKIRSDALLNTTLTVKAEIVNNATRLTELTKNVSLKIAPKNYTLNFVTDGGSVFDENNEAVNELSVNEDEIPSFTEAKTGSSFIGWFEDPNFNIEFDRSKPITNDTTIYAKWELQSFTLSFDTQGGDPIAPITSCYGTPITIPTPTRQNHTFLSWDRESPAFMPAENVTLTAHWVNIIYNTEGLSVNDKTVNDEILLGENIPVSAEGIKKIHSASLLKYSDFYNAIGWFDSAGTQISYANGELIPSVEGYTDSSGKWIFDPDSQVTLHLQIAQKYPEYTYISSANDMRLIDQDLDGKYMLIDDVEMSSIFFWTRLGLDNWKHSKHGSSPKPFKGELEGNGKKITFEIDLESADVNSDNDYALGLFSSLSGAVIRNLTIRCTVSAKDFDAYAVSVGGIAGTAINSTFENCHVESGSTVKNEWTDRTYYVFLSGMKCTGATYCGGLVGDARNCTFTSCTNEATVTAKGYSAYSGGIAGSAYGCSFSNCENDGSVSSEHGNWLWGAHNSGNLYGKNNEYWLRPDDSNITD